MSRDDPYEVPSPRQHVQPHHDVTTRIGATRRAMELTALVLVAVTPVLPYLLSTLSEGVARFSIAGDFALLEQATRHASRGEALLGPYSRFHWHHPGPMFFYLVAPFQALFDPASTGLFVGTCALNAASAASLVWLLRECTTRTHAICGLAVLLAWFAAFGNVLPNPWNPLVIILPMMTFLLACSVLARGDARALAPGAFFGALALSTHIATATTVVIAAIAALAAFFLRRRSRTTRIGRPHLVAASAILLLAFLPPIIEQVTASRGNMRRLVGFFIDRQVPSKSLATAARNALVATSWMPDRVFERALPQEGWIAHGMRWDPMPTHVTQTAMTIGVIHVLSIAVAAVVALRRRDGTSLSILAFGVFGQLVALSSFRAIVGDDLHYLIFWTTATSSVTWIGVLSALSSAALGVAWVRKARPVMAPALVVVGLAATIVATSFQRRWLAKNPGTPGSYPALELTMRALHSGLRERLERDGATPVIHLEGAYDLAEAMVLELEKDGVDVRVVNVDRWQFTAVRSEEGVSRPLHVWFAQPVLPLAKAPCLERIAEASGSAVYVAPVDSGPCRTGG